MKKIIAMCLFAASFLQASLAFAGNYYIELAVFRNNQANPSAEIWKTDIPALDTSKAVEPDHASLTKGYIPLAKLRNSPDYTLLEAASWKQEAPIRSNITPRYIHAEKAGYSLQGTVSFYQQRFLFMDVDLRLRDKQSGQVYQLKQHKRVKPKEMHYFDHPMFGAVLYLQRSGKQ